MNPSVSVIVVTLNRPDFVRRCLNCLLSQSPRPDEVIVVDASADDRTRRVCDEFPSVLYLRNENGFGRMTASRNIGLAHACGDIIAFVDDDAFAHAGWLANLLAPYADPGVGAVGGRALNRQPGEELLGVNEVGRLKPNGNLSGYFAADPGRIIEVDHVMGCNMSFRRAVLAQLGGFREDYPGISGIREDSDMCLRVGAAGWRILFNPAACVDHEGAGQATGRRFDARYCYYLQRNHVCLLLRNYGPGSPRLWRYLAFSVYQPFGELARKVAAAMAKFLSTLFGTVVGLIAGAWLLIKSGRDPVRRDPAGRTIAGKLGAARAPVPPSTSETVNTGIGAMPAPLRMAVSCTPHQRAG